MKSLDSKKAGLLRRMILGTMLLAGVVLITAIFLTITGTYENYPARLAAESVLNRTALGALLTLVGAWYGHVFSKPFLTPACAKHAAT